MTSVVVLTLTAVVLAGCGAAAPPVPELTATVSTTVSPTATLPASPVSPPLPATPLATPVPPPVPAFTNDRASLGPLIWASAIDATTNAPTTPVRAFVITDRTLYAVIPVERIVGGTELAATWEYNNTSLDNFDQRLVADHDNDLVYVEFHLTRTGDEAWPNGVYEIAVTVNQAPAISATVEVQ